jgi:glutaredoxin
MIFHIFTGVFVYRNMVQVMGLKCTLIGLILLVNVCISASSQSTEKYLTLYFAYNNICELCNEDKEMLDYINAQIKDITDKPRILFDAYNIFIENNAFQFDQILKRLGMGDQRIKPPVLIIGDKYLSGNEEIRTGTRDLFLRQMEIFSTDRVSPEWMVPNLSIPDITAKISPGTQIPPELHNAKASDSILICFVTSGCASCEKVKQLLSSLPTSIDLDNREQSEIKIIYYNVNEGQGLVEIRHFFNHFGVSEHYQIVPIVFYTGGWLSGFENIEKNLNHVLLRGEARNFVYPGTVTKKSALAELSTLFLVGIVGGVNLCSISIFLFLLSLLVVKSGNVLSLSLSYVTARLIMYSAIGFSILFTAQTLNRNILITAPTVYTVTALLCYTFAVAILPSIVALLYLHGKKAFNSLSPFLFRAAL